MFTGSILPTLLTFSLQDFETPVVEENSSAESKETKKSLYDGLKTPEQQNVNLLYPNVAGVCCW